MTETLDKAFNLVSLQDNNDIYMRIFVIDEAGIIICTYIYVCMHILSVH